MYVCIYLVVYAFGTFLKACMHLVHKRHHWSHSSRDLHIHNAAVITNLVILQFWLLNSIGHRSDSDVPDP